MLPNRIEPTEDDCETFTPWDDYAWQSIVLPSERFYRLGRWNGWTEDRTSIDEGEAEVVEVEDADQIREWIAELPPNRRPRSRKKSM